MAMFASASFFSRRMVSAHPLSNLPPPTMGGSLQNDRVTVPLSLTTEVLGVKAAPEPMAGSYASADEPSIFEASGSCSSV